MRVEAVVAIRASDAADTIGIVRIAEVNIIFVKNISEVDSAIIDINGHIIVEPLGNSTGGTNLPGQKTKSRFEGSNRLGLGLQSYQLCCSNV